MVVAWQRELRRCRRLRAKTVSSRPSRANDAPRALPKTLAGFAFQHGLDRCCTRLRLEAPSAWLRFLPPQSFWSSTKTEEEMYIRLAFLVLASLGLTTTHAFAYIDPGTGSVVTAAIIGFFAAITYTARKYFYRIKDIFMTRKTTAYSASDKKEK